MLTIFTVPKPFDGHDGVIQRNAIRSWTKLRPACEIILLGNDNGIAEIADRLGIRHIPDIACNEYGTPMVDDMFREAQQAANNEIVGYVNADIILLDDFMPSVERIHLDRFLLVGRRWDIEQTELLDFDCSGWETQYRKIVAERGRLHAPSGIDYFVFPRGMYRDIPPFALGRTTWDNWFVFHARSQHIPVIDATRSITAVHQEHGYAHVKEGKSGAFTGPEARQNQALLGSWEYSLCIDHANWILTPQGLGHAITIPRLYHQIAVIFILHPRLRFLGTLRRRAMIVLSKAVRLFLGKNRK